MKQFQGNNLLKIDITHTVEVSSKGSIAEEPLSPSHIIPVSSSRDEGHLLPPPGFHAGQYALIRLPQVELGMKIWLRDEMSSMEQLSDGSWEICINRTWASDPYS